MTRNAFGLTVKDVIITIIKNDGICNKTLPLVGCSALNCPLNCIITKSSEERKRQAINFYLEHYGTEIDLVELLL